MLKNAWMFGALLLLGGCMTGSVSQDGAEARPVQVEMQTSMGTISLELDPVRAPETVRNFVSYAQSGFYNGTIFHRVINGFMIQGGGFTPNLTEKTTAQPIRNEAANGLRNARGTIAMARTMFIDSATSQFFINHKDNPFLDHHALDMQRYGYAVFGHVTAGMDVVDAIATVPTCNVGPYGDVPRKPVVIEKVTVRR